MSEYLKAFLMAPIMGPITGLLVVVCYSLKLPEPYYIFSFIGLGTILSYAVMAIVGIPLVYLLIRFKIYSLTALLFCSLAVSILMSVIFLKSKDASIDLWLFVTSVLLASSVSVCITFWYIARK